MALIGALIAFLAILTYTVFGRMPSSTHTYVFAIPDSNEFLREMFMNALLYVPLGMGLSVFVGRWSILVGLLLSTGIEAWQYLMGTGVAQGTDVITNTIGTIVGSVPWLLKGNSITHQQRELTTEQQSFLHCLRSALFTGESIQLSDAVITEAQQQAVLPLISTGVEVYQIIAQNVWIAYEQREVGKALSSVPYAVLKGLAAAAYYPEPLRRVLGDIDIIVRPEDFPAAYHALQSNGYSTEDPLVSANRHVRFDRNGIKIELHRKYACLNTKEQEMLLDAWIYEGIPHAVACQVQNHSFPILPEPLNGLTLLAHINQHLEDGLGIRQIIDWVMYVDKKLRDDSWADFRKLTDQLGLTKLAMATARLGQLYLGLSDSIVWCRDIDDQVSANLLQYVIDCANFGVKEPTSNTITMVLSHSKGVAGLFRNLQMRGERNWNFLKKHPRLKPFAWLYQSFRYAVKGLKRDRAFSEFRKDIAASKQRNRLMESLGARQMAKRNRDG